MNEAEQKNLFSGIATFVKEEIAKATKPLREQLSELQKGMEDWGYVGTFTEGYVYRRGNFVTLSGSMWSCCADATTERPTTSCKDWMLAVKRGRDGKGAEPRRTTAPRSSA